LTDAPKRLTSADICRDHAICLRNAKFFRGPQECGLCERRPATHYLNGASGTGSFALRCDGCLLSRQGCPHVTSASGVMPSGEPLTAICAECYDWVSLSIEFPRDGLLADLEWLGDRVREGRGPVTLAMTENGDIGLVLSDDPSDENVKCAGTGDEVMDAIAAARRNRPEFEVTR